MLSAAGVSGGALERALDTELPLRALRMALAARPVPRGLIHHSDPGVPYASTDYTNLLQASGVRIRMSRQGNPYDNAKAESFLKTLKYEEVYLWEYEDLTEARQRIGFFLEAVYNRKRRHSALGYRPPVEFEQALTGAPSALLSVSFQGFTPIGRGKRSWFSWDQRARNRLIEIESGILPRFS